MKKYSNWLKTTFAVVAISFSPMTLAQTDISKFFQGLESFSADFSQVVKQEGEVVQQSTGTVQLKKPLKFRWDYQSPEKMQLISDGKKFYHYDIDLAQVTVKPAASVTDSALSTLFSNQRKLTDVFIIKPISLSAIQKAFPKQARQWQANATQFYQLTPKAKQNAVAQKIIIGLNYFEQLSVFYIRDDFGENTFIFSKIHQNKSLGNKHFQFVPPKGVDVLGQ